MGMNPHPDLQGRKIHAALERRAHLSLSADSPLTSCIQHSLRESSVPREGAREEPEAWSWWASSAQPNSGPRGMEETAAGTQQASQTCAD